MKPDPAHDALIAHEIYGLPPGDTRTHPHEWDEAQPRPVLIGVDHSSGPDTVAIVEMVTLQGHTICRPLTARPYSSQPDPEGAEDRGE